MSYNATAFSLLQQRIADAEAANAELALAMDESWKLIICALIFIMQAGFAMLEIGSVQDKNIRTILLKNMSDFSLGVLGFWLLGFPVEHARAPGDGDGWFIGGTQGWFISGTTDMSTFVFQLMFCTTTTTIISGAVASRITFEAYFAAGLVMCTFTHPLLAHWIWQGGWLSTGNWRVIDFAGGIPVHVCGGLFALIGAKMVGPRRGRFVEDGSGGYKDGSLKKYNVVFSALGVFLLWIGWYGFNPGSTAAVTGGKVHVSAHASVTTSLAAAASLFTSLALSTLYDGVHDLWQCMNGLLAGLVAITPACATVDTWSSLLVGFVASFVVRIVSHWVDKAGIDDVVDAFAVHFACGVLGLFFSAVLSTQDLIDLHYGAGVVDFRPGRQLLVHTVAVLACSGVVALCAVVTFASMMACRRLRVSEEDELTGLDFKYHGGFKMKTFAEQVQEAAENDRIRRKVSQIVMKRRQAKGQHHVINPIAAVSSVFSRSQRRSSTHASNPRLTDTSLEEESERKPASSGRARSNSRSLYSKRGRRATTSGSNSGSSRGGGSSSRFSRVKAIKQRQQSQSSAAPGEVSIAMTDVATHRDAE